MSNVLFGTDFEDEYFGDDDIDEIEEVEGIDAIDDIDEPEPNDFTESDAIDEPEIPEPETVLNNTDEKGSNENTAVKEDTDTSPLETPVSNISNNNRPEDVVSVNSENDNNKDSKPIPEKNNEPISLYQQQGFDSYTRESEERLNNDSEKKDSEQKVKPEESLKEEVPEAETVKAFTEKSHTEADDTEKNDNSIIIKINSKKLKTVLGIAAVVGVIIISNIALSSTFSKKKTNSMVINTEQTTAETKEKSTIEQIFDDNYKSDIDIIDSNLISKDVDNQLDNQETETTESIQSSQMDNSVAAIDGISDRFNNIEELDEYINASIKNIYSNEKIDFNKYINGTLSREKLLSKYVDYLKGSNELLHLLTVNKAEYLNSDTVNYEQTENQIVNSLKYVDVIYYLVKKGTLKSDILNIINQ